MPYPSLTLDSEFKSSVREGALLDEALRNHSKGVLLVPAQAKVRAGVGVSTSSRLSNRNPDPPPPLRFLRYPGGKRHMWPELSKVLLRQQGTFTRYIEPFVGGGATFFFVRPAVAVLSDVNSELIDLYLGVRHDPEAVWAEYKAFPSTRRGYYEARALDPHSLPLVTRAARLLFLNRTCFKGMWRHNAAGAFNVGYGGQSRRWVITAEDLLEVAKSLEGVHLICSDFEAVVDGAGQGDLIFVDPPYRRGYREQLHEHYVGGRFTFEDQTRLAAALGRAFERGVRWAATNSSHKDLLDLYAQLGPSVQIRRLGKGEALVTSKA